MDPTFEFNGAARLHCAASVLMDGLGVDTKANPLTARRSAALCCRATRLLGGARFSQTARDVLVKNAGNKHLVQHAFFKCPDLNVAQVAGGQTDIDPAILNGCGTRGCLELRKLAFRSNGPKLAFLKGAEDF